MAGFDTWGQMFVDAGFVYVEPNVRGSSGYGKAGCTRTTAQSGSM